VDAFCRQPDERCVLAGHGVEATGSVTGAGPRRSVQRRTRTRERTDGRSPESQRDTLVAAATERSRGGEPRRTSLGIGGAVRPHTGTCARLRPDTRFSPGWRLREFFSEVLDWAHLLRPGSK